jgi:site-specific DNA recombinase
LYPERGNERLDPAKTSVTRCPSLRFMIMNNESLKYFIYVRKSSEGKDRQALSHEGQLEEIQKIVEREGLFVVDTFRESKSAHMPDNRPLFDEMLRRIRRGEANGIIAWHTNRLSRNPKKLG